MTPQFLSRAPTITIALLVALSLAPAVTAQIIGGPRRRRGGLAARVIAGIVVACVVGSIIVLFIVCSRVRRRRRTGGAGGRAETRAPARPGLLGRLPCFGGRARRTQGIENNVHGAGAGVGGGASGFSKQPGAGPAHDGMGPAAPPPAYGGNGNNGQPFVGGFKQGV